MSASHRLARFLLIVTFETPVYMHIGIVVYMYVCAYIFMDAFCFILNQIYHVAVHLILTR